MSKTIKEAIFDEIRPSLTKHYRDYFIKALAGYACEGIAKWVIQACAGIESSAINDILKELKK